MSDNIYEITKMMQDKKNIQKDMEEAFSLVVKMLQEKYTNRIFKILQERQTQLEKNPSKEIRLLNALKPFLHVSSHNNLEKTIKACLLKDTLNSFRLESTNIKNNNMENKKMENKINEDFIKDPSIHLDGIYDLDTACLKNSKNFNNNINNNFSDSLLLLILFNLL